MSHAICSVALPLQLKHVFHCVDMHDKSQKEPWLLILSSCIPAFSGCKTQLSLMKGLHSSRLVRFAVFCFVCSDDLSWNDLSWNNPAYILESCKSCFSYSIYCNICHLRSQRIFCFYIVILKHDNKLLASVRVWRFVGWTVVDCSQFFLLQQVSLAQNMPRCLDNHSKVFGNSSWIIWELTDRQTQGNQQLVI